MKTLTALNNNKPCFYYIFSVPKKLSMSNEKEMPPKKRPRKSESDKMAADSAKKTEAMLKTPKDTLISENPTVADICQNLGLNDVDLGHTAEDYRNITSYELFQESYTEKVQQANPKAPKAQLALLLSGKWTEFQRVAKESQQSAEEVEVSKGGSRRRTLRRSGH